MFIECSSQHFARSDCPRQTPLQPGTDKGALSCNDLLCHRVHRFRQAGSMIDPASATTCRDVSAVLIAPFGPLDPRMLGLRQVRDRRRIDRNGLGCFSMTDFQPQCIKGRAAYRISFVSNFASAPCQMFATLCKTKGASYPPIEMAGSVNKTVMWLAIWSKNIWKECVYKICMHDITRVMHQCNIRTFCCIFDTSRCIPQVQKTIVNRLGHEPSHELDHNCSFLYRQSAMFSALALKGSTLWWSDCWSRPQLGPGRKLWWNGSAAEFFKETLCRSSLPSPRSKSGQGRAVHSRNLYIQYSLIISCS